MARRRSRRRRSLSASAHSIQFLVKLRGVLTNIWDTRFSSIRNNLLARKGNFNFYGIERKASSSSPEMEKAAITKTLTWYCGCAVSAAEELS
jgi:hypothetical protein